MLDYHAADWVQRVRAAFPGGVDLLLDCAGGQTRDQAIGAVRDGGRVISIVLAGPPARLERGVAGESFAAHGGRERLEALSRLVDADTLRPQVEAVLPFDQAREALTRVAGRRTRGKIVTGSGSSGTACKPSPWTGAARAALRAETQFGCASSGQAVDM